MEKNSRELVVLLPAYNEEGNVERMLERWEAESQCIEQHGLVLRIVAVNDGSSDRTHDLCRILEEKYENFTLVEHEHNKGLGEAVKTGFRYVLEHCPDAAYACLMDCDNTQDPANIGRMLDRILQTEDPADVVIASRYQEGSEVYGVAKHRLFTSGGARLVYETLLGVKNVRDYTCGYRLYSRKSLELLQKGFGDQMIEESGFTCMAEVLYKMNLCGVRFTEVPFTLHYDFKEGESKMKVLKTAVNSLKLTFRLRRLKPRQESMV